MLGVVQYQLSISHFKRHNLELRSDLPGFAAAIPALSGPPHLDQQPKDNQWRRTHSRPATSESKALFFRDDSPAEAGTAAPGARGPEDSGELVVLRHVSGCAREKDCDVDQGGNVLGEIGYRYLLLNGNSCCDVNGLSIRIA